MTKPELIDTIRSVNETATREFLAEFSERDLTDYVNQLRGIGLLPHREPAAAAKWATSAARRSHA